MRSPAIACVPGDPALAFLVEVDKSHGAVLGAGTDDIGGDEVVGESPPCVAGLPDDVHADEHDVRV